MLCGNNSLLTETKFSIAFRFFRHLHKNVLESDRYRASKNLQTREVRRTI